MEKTLLEQHKKQLLESAICDKVAEERGYYSATKKSQLNDIGFKDYQRSVPGMVIPVHSVNGTLSNYQFRPDTPRIAKDKPVKYETPAGSKMTIDVPPRCLKDLQNPEKDLWITEGAKKADAGASIGLCIIDLLGVWGFRGTNDMGGKTALPDWESIALNCRNVFICFDSDVMQKAQVHAALSRLGKFLGSRGAKVSYIYLVPGKNNGKVGLDDYLHSGGEISNLIENSVSKLKEVPKEDAGLPEVILPGNGQKIITAGQELGELLAATKTFFNRGRVVVEIEHEDGVPCILPKKAHQMSSRFESVAKLLTNTKDGPVETICSSDKAKLIMESLPFLSALPKLNLISPCSVLAEIDGKLSEIINYDPKTGIYACGESVVSMSVDEAREVLGEVICDFDFKTEGDRSRALSAIITPAMVMGELLPGRAPMDLGEADQSQSGKGYRNKITAAIYRCGVKTVTQRKTGVGSLEEALNNTFIQGDIFVSIDNFRGRIDSPAVESFLTEDSYIARSAYSRETEIDPRRIILMMTSNKAELTRDLSNRSSIVRIQKQAKDYQYREYSNKRDILTHVRENQSKFLGAVFAIIRAWYDAGEPRTDETRHDFRGWAQTMDWIVQNLLDSAPLLDGHDEVRERLTNPSLSWLRDVARSLQRVGAYDRWLRTNDILNYIAEDMEVDVPGVRDGEDLTDDNVHKTALRAMGRRLGVCFNGNDEIELDGVLVVKKESYNVERGRKVIEYGFSGPVSP